MSLVKTPMNSDATRFSVMNMNRDVEDSSFRVRPSWTDRFCPLWIQQRSQSSRGCWWCKAMPYVLGLSWADFPRFPDLRTHDRRRDRQWTRPDGLTAREQHHPGVTHPADEIWLLTRLQALPPECGPPPALVRGQGDWWCVLEMAQICRENQSYSFDDWSEYHTGPNSTLEMFRDSGRNGSDSNL